MYLPLGQDIMRVGMTPAAREVRDRSSIDVGLPVSTSEVDERVVLSARLLMLSVARFHPSSLLVVCLAMSVPSSFAQETSRPLLLTEIPRTTENLRTAFDAAQKHAARPLPEEYPLRYTR